MKKTTLILCTILFFTLTAIGQTPKKVHTFPEEYVGKIITFKNIRYWPILEEFSGYYTVQIDLSTPETILNLSVYNETEWGFKLLNKIVGVVEKDIARLMINKEVGGYNTFYYGTITGTVIKSDKIFGSDYLFVITKIINHLPFKPDNVIDVFKKTK